MKIFNFITFILLSSTSTAVVPPYSPEIRNNAVMRDEMIKSYFNPGLIAPFLVSVHGIAISLRQLKRILRRLGCQAAKSQLSSKSQLCRKQVA